MSKHGKYLLTYILFQIIYCVYACYPVCVSEGAHVCRHEHMTHVCMHVEVQYIVYLPISLLALNAEVGLLIFSTSLTAQFATLIP